MLKVGDPYHPTQVQTQIDSLKRYYREEGYPRAEFEARTDTLADKSLELTFQVVEGEFKGRMLWARLNLDNPNPLAVKIARGELSAMCRAVGIMEPKDSCELHNLPLLITVKQKTDSDGEVRNEIKGYAKREVANGKPAQAANPTPPWRRG